MPSQAFARNDLAMKLHFKSDVSRMATLQQRASQTVTAERSDRKAPCRAEVDRCNFISEMSVRPGRTTATAAQELIVADIVDLPFSDRTAER